MSKSNGVLRVNRKGRQKCAFGEEGSPGEVVFEVDVVDTFQQWIDVDEGFRADTEDRTIEDMPAYHRAAVEFVRRLAGDAATQTNFTITTAEALDFLARLREVYDDLAAFFRPRSPEERGLPATLAAASPDTSPRTELRFSTEPG